MEDIYFKMLEHWGIDAQRWALMEEMGEVMQALSHEKRGRSGMSKVAKELVDLQTVLNSVRIYYMSDDEWNERIQFAEDRLKNKLAK